MRPPPRNRPVPHHADRGCGTLNSNDVLLQQIGERQLRWQAPHRIAVVCAGHADRSPLLIAASNSCALEGSCTRAIAASARGPSIDGMLPASVWTRSAVAARSLGQRLIWIAGPHVPHVLAESLLAIIAVVAPFSHEFRDALLLAALAAFCIEVTFIETERFSRRGDRANALAAVSSAARSLLDARLSEPDLSAFPVGIDRRVVTLRGLGCGERLDLADQRVRSELLDVWDRLHDLRGTFAASIGAQMPFLEPPDQRSSVAALRGLGRGLLALEEGASVARLCELIASSGVRGEALRQFERANLEPLVAEFHDVARSAVVEASRLERGVAAWGTVPARPGVRQREAARSVAAALVNRVVTHGVRINWYEQSALAGRDDVTMRLVAACKELGFTGDARAHGWSSLHEYLRQEEQALAAGLEATAATLSAGEHAAVEAFCQEVAAAARAAYQAGEAIRSADDALVKGLPGEQIARANAATFETDMAFIQQIRRAVEAADAALRLLT